MLNAINTFKNDESGAVTVDWVVLTAALVGLGLAVMGVVSGGIEDLSTDINSSLTDTDPLTNPFTNNSDGISGTPPA
jgi:Flp pilus assembly pilin Flp